MEMQNAGLAVNHLVNKNSFLNSGWHQLELLEIVGFIQQVKGNNDAFNYNDIPIFEAFEICLVYTLKKYSVPSKAIEAMLNERYAEKLFNLPESKWLPGFADVWDQVFYAAVDTPTDLRAFYCRTGFKKAFKALDAV